MPFIAFSVDETICSLHTKQSRFQTFPGQAQLGIAEGTRQGSFFMVGNSNQPRAQLSILVVLVLSAALSIVLAQSILAEET
jgi:hypothetical protein